MSGQGTPFGRGCLLIVVVGLSVLLAVAGALGYVVQAVG